MRHQAEYHATIAGLGDDGMDLEGVWTCGNELFDRDRTDVLQIPSKDAGHKEGDASGEGNNGKYTLSSIPSSCDKTLVISFVEHPHHQRERLTYNP